MSTFEQCRTLLESLITLCNAGNGDSKEADDIRDKMDGLWWRLSDDEQERLKLISIAAQ